MAPKKEHYQLLLEKYLANKCTSAEAEELFYYLNQDNSGKVLLKELQREFKHSLNATDTIPEEVSNRIWNKLEANTRVSVVPLYGRRKWLIRVAAAIALMVLTTGLYKYLQKNTLVPLASTRQFRNDVSPGGNKAVLTLADGSQIILDDVQEGTITKQGNTLISKAKDGQLVYDLSNSGELASASEIVYNTISTPKGGQYQVILPDGSKVWLNAASSLKFPTKFTGKQRNVELNGEAYFEIEKNKEMPFQVAVNDMKVEVLGTHFNVTAYDDDDFHATTLLEGSVKISNKTGQMLLTPGQQAVVNKSDKIKVFSVDTEEAVAWKKGYFLFNNENIKSIMKKVSRWYDVEVTYQGDMTNEEFTGTISRFKNVSEVLKLLELTKDVHFEIVADNAAGKGRRITVMP